jgi:hypothetical protein
MKVRNMVVYPCKPSKHQLFQAHRGLGGLFFLSTCFGQVRADRGSLILRKGISQTFPPLLLGKTENNR